MSEDDRIADVIRLVREVKKTAGPAGISPNEICRHVASSLRVSDDIAKALIIEAGLRGANPWPPEAS